MNAHAPPSRLAPHPERQYLDLLADLLANGVRRGDRVAQLVVQPVVRARFLPVEQLPESTRGAGGHGSTGGHASVQEKGAD